MAQPGKTAQPASSNAEKDPDDWVTGEEPMTGAQRSYLKTLSDEAKVEFDDSLNKADASRRIDELQHQTGRGLDTPATASAAARPDRPAAKPGAARDDGSSQAGELDVDGDGAR